ncbi:hypothetical protein BC937DRAFT_90773 [Endogone sp. FLAS-F59071]|nr:hypothetical protein BC937DRAFT_90773 [Endogone sp. FLAS-F59071]|eukprot:RUS16807.1 hypothetical protein BC937DRAFT_90773 [Endogone sp. FLAS-F59071]
MDGRAEERLPRPGVRDLDAIRHNRQISDPHYNGMGCCLPAMEILHPLAPKISQPGRSKKKP